MESKTICSACMHPVFSLDVNCPFCGAHATKSCVTCGAPTIRVPSALTKSGYIYSCQACVYTAFMKTQK